MVRFVRRGGRPARPGTERSVDRAVLRRLAALLAVVVLAVSAACTRSANEDRGSAGDDPADEGTARGERPVQVVGAGKVRLFGTLAVPDAGAAAASAGVLIVPSSGPGTRDGLVSDTGSNDSIAKDLAGALSKAGTVSYRFDRRGTGESRIEPDVRLSFDDLVADARAGLDLLAQRKETSGRDLAVVGYDQGGLVALRLAASDSRVTRLVLISPPGRSLVDAQAAQLGGTYGPESAAALRATVAALLATRTLPPLDAMRAELRPLLPPQEASFLAQLYAIDPAAEAAQVKARSLIVVGGDAGPYDPDRLRAVLSASDVVVAATAGPTLVNVGPPPTEDPGNPSSPVHDHGAAPAVAPEARDADATNRITAFLTAARAP